MKREREARGVSLEEISEQTKIGVRLLKAIEAEQFHQLPGGIFDRSFVRQYARCLGLEEESVLRDYLLAAGVTREGQPRLAPNASSASSPLSGYWGVVLAAVGFGVLAVVLWYTLYRFAGRPEAPPSSATTALSESSESSEDSEDSADSADSGSGESPAGTASTEAPVEQPEPGPGSPAGRPPAGPSQGSDPSTLRSLPQTVPPPAGTTVEPGDAAGGISQELLLQIMSRDPVWLSISSDGEKQWQGTMRPREIRHARATESFQLTVGDAGGVDLTLNGKPLPPLGRSGEVKTVTITSRSIPEAAP